MRPGLLAADIPEPGLHVELVKSGTLLVLWRSINGRRDGCFGAVFMGISKGLEYSGKRTGDRSIRSLIKHIQYLLFIGILK